NLDNRKQNDRPGKHRPPRINSEGQYDWKEGGDPSADIGQKAKQHRQDAPQDRAGHANEEEPRSDYDAKAGVDRDLRQEIATEPACAIIERYSGPVQIAGADKKYEPVTQILSLKQDKNQKDNDDTSRRQRPGERPNDAADDLERGRRRRMNLDRDRLRELFRLRRCLGRRGRVRSRLLS